MDNLKANMKRVCLPLLFVAAMLGSLRLCAAYKWTSMDKDVNGNVGGLVLNQDNCGQLIDKFLTGLNLDSTQRSFVLRSLEPLGDQVVHRVTASEIIGLNNSGVNALKVNNYELAIEKFETAIKLDPGYDLAAMNLAIAHNNYGLQLRNEPAAALKEFHQALFLNRTNPTTMQNVEAIIKMMGKDPQNFAHRVELGDHEQSERDFVGAFMEYRAALQLKGDSLIKAKLHEVYRKLNPTDKAMAKAASTAYGATDQQD